MPEDTQNHHIKIGGNGLAVYSSGLEIFMQSRLYIFRPDPGFQPPARPSFEDIKSQLRDGNYFPITHSLIDRVLVGPEEVWVSEAYVGAIAKANAQANQQAPQIKVNYDAMCRVGKVVIEISGQYSNPIATANRLLEESKGLLERMV